MTTTTTRKEPWLKMNEDDTTVSQKTLSRKIRVCRGKSVREGGIRNTL